MGKERNIAVCIILSLVTCGIYGIYWFICLNDEMNIAHGQPGTSGGVAFLLTIVTCGIYGIYWAYVQGEKVDDIRERCSVARSSNGILYLVLTIVGLQIVVYALLQNELNMMARASR